MRIYAFTAGAAQMYCGSCLRDNALAAALRTAGHDVVLMPLYTPTLVDEENVSSGPVFFGGISIYLQHHSRLFRNTPWFLDKLWDSRYALNAASKRSIPVDPRFLGEMTVSMLDGEDGPYRKEFEKMQRQLRQLPAPDIVTLPNSLVISLAPVVKRSLRAPLIVTLQGEDLFLDGLKEPYRTQSVERIRALTRHADGFVAVSDFGARLMSSRLGIAAERMHVVPLGVNVRDLEKRHERRDGVFRIGYMARVAPEKSLHQLCDAYRWLRHEGGLPPSRLEAAGYLAPEHEEYLAILHRQMEEWGLGGEFHYHGKLDRAAKIEFLRSLDVLSVPSTYADPKGLYVLEALACGVPVVQPNHGAFPELIARTAGGLLAEPDHPVSFGQQILRLFHDPALRAELGHRGYASVREHHTVERMAARAAEVYSGALSASPISSSETVEVPK